MSLVRSATAGFIKQNPTAILSDQTLEHWARQEQSPGIEEYVQQQVLPLGVEARDLVLYVLPIVFRCSINLHTTDLTARFCSRALRARVLNVITTWRTRILSSWSRRTSWTCIKKSSVWSSSMAPTTFFAQMVSPSTRSTPNSKTGY